ncbi:peptidylprolyl isomerase [Roseobacteraceae bacterium NS-SX3]
MSKALFPDLVVNGEHVPHAEIAAEAQNHDAPKDKPGLAWRKAANAIAVRTLLLQEARRRGIPADCQAMEPGRFETEEEALIRGLLDEAVEAQAPSEDAVKAEWARDPDRFRAPPLWEVSHILCACDPRDAAARDKAQARAAALAVQAAENPRRFAALAAEESDCGSKSAGGVLGQLGPGDTVPEFEAALRRLKDGQITAEPVATRFGFHVIRMDAAAEGAVLPFEAVRPKLAEAMEKAAWAAAAKAFTGELIAAAKIEGVKVAPL